MPRDLAQERVDRAADQFVDLAEIDGRLETPRQTFAGGAALRRRARRHVSQRIAHAIDGEFHRMRKFRIEQQELRDLFRLDRRRVLFAIGLERRAVFEQAQPVEIFGRCGEFGMGLRAEMDVEQAAHQLRALDEAAELEEVPAFAMAQRGVGDAAQRVDLLQHIAEQPRRLMHPDLFDGDGLEPEIEAIQMLPHFRRQLLAHLPRIVAREAERIHQRRRIVAREGERCGDREGIVRLRGEFFRRQ